MPSLLTPGISDEDAHTRATSSMTMHVGYRVRALAAVLLGDVHRGEPGVVEDLECFFRKPGVLVDIGGVRGDLLLAQIAQHGRQLIVLVG